MYLPLFQPISPAKVLKFMYCSIKSAILKITVLAIFHAKNFHQIEILNMCDFKAVAIMLECSKEQKTDFQNGGLNTVVHKLQGPGG